MKKIFFLDFSYPSTQETRPPTLWVEGGLAIKPYRQRLCDYFGSGVGQKMGHF